MYLPALLSLIHVSIARISYTCVFISFIYSHAFPPVAPPSPPPPCRVKARQTPPETPPGVSVPWISAFSPSRSLGRRGHPAEGSAAAAAAAPAVFDSSPAAPQRLASRGGPRRPLARPGRVAGRPILRREGEGPSVPERVGCQARAKAGAGGGRSAERHSGDGGEARKGEDAAQDWAFYVPLDPRYGSMIRPLSKGT